MSTGSPREEPIEAVTFDLWATLIGSPEIGGEARHRARVEAMADALRQTGQPADVARIEAVLSRDEERFCHIWAVERRTLHNHDRLRWIVDQLGRAPLHMTLERKVCQAFDESLFAGPPGFAHDALHTVRALHERGVRLGVISDTSFSTGRSLRKLLANQGLLRYFETLIFSDEIGCSKPASKPFNLAAHALGVPTARIAHVGDNLVNDVRGAREAGLVAVWYDPQRSKEAPRDRAPHIVIHALAELLERL